MRHIERQAFTQPVDGWLIALWTQGVGLVVAGSAAAVWEPLRFWYPCGLAAMAYAATAVFFLVALPAPDASVKEGLLPALALSLFRLLPAPRPWVRAAFLSATVAPLAGHRGEAWFWWACFLAGVMIAGAVLRRQDAGLRVTWWDRWAPYAMSGLVALYLLAGFDERLGLDVAAAGLAFTWLAEALLLRQAAARQWAEVARIVREERGVPLAEIPLDDYVAETSAPEPGPAPAEADAGGAVLVGTGAFRVDASKMLEKLRERQLADAGDFVRAWLRCAVASGARDIALDGGWYSLRLGFDGHPFSAQQLREPYRALLDTEAEDSQRGAQFAYGLLAVLRMKPASVWIFSGEGRERARSILSSRRAGDEAGPDDTGRGTLVVVRFSGLAGLWRPFLAGRRARSGFGLSEAALSIGGRPQPDPFAISGGWTVGARGGWRYALRARPGEAASRLRVYHLGAFVEEFEEPTELRAQVDAAFSHDELRLSLSQSSVVRDERFRGWVRVVQAAGSRLPPAR